MKSVPNCDRLDCRFVSLGMSATAVHSPIVYDKYGNPVAGGSNRITETVECITCGKRFTNSQTELEIAQEEIPNWKEYE